MEIEEYRKQFIDDIRNDASLEGSDPESYFIERVLTDLEDIGELNDPIPMSVEIRNSKRQILAFDGYSYDEADGALVLIVSEFTNQRDSTPTLTNTRIEELLSYMQRFVEESVNGNIRNLKIDYADITDSGTTGVNCSGALTGYCSGNATFTNISVTNTNVKGFGKIGGLIGMQEFGTATLHNCSISNTTIDGSYNCAGFIGLAQGTVSANGCNSQNIKFDREYSTTSKYVEVNEGELIGTYWVQDEEPTSYYAAWSNLYNDFEQETINGITYIGKCHNY